MYNNNKREHTFSFGWDVDSLCILVVHYPLKVLAYVKSSSSSSHGNQQMAITMIKKRTETIRQSKFLNSKQTSQKWFCFTLAIGFNWGGQLVSIHFGKVEKISNKSSISPKKWNSPNKYLRYFGQINIAESRWRCLFFTLFLASNPFFHLFSFNPMDFIVVFGTSHCWFFVVEILHWQCLCSLFRRHFKWNASTEQKYHVKLCNKCGFHSNKHLSCILYIYNRFICDSSI